MEATLKENVKRRNTWVRALYMLMFAVIYQVTELVLWAVVVLQFLFALFAGRPNARLLTFGQGLSSFVYEILRYLTYNSEERPFPFAPWPGTGSEASPGRLPGDAGSSA